MANGTIALTNRLYDPGTGTLQVSCDKIVGQWGVFNLYDKNLSTLCKIDASTTANLDFFFSEPMLIYGVIFIHHNLTPGDQLVFQASHSTSFTSPPVNNNFSAIQSWKNAFYINNSGHYYQYYRVQIEASQTVEIGQAFLLGYFTYTFEKNFNKPIRTTYQPGRTQNTTYYGSDISDIRHQKNRKQLNFELIKPEQHDTIVKAFQGEYFLIDPYGSPSTYFYDAKFCKFESLQTEEIQGEGYTRYNLSMEYIEQPVVRTISGEPPQPQ